MTDDTDDGPDDGPDDAPGAAGPDGEPRKRRRRRRRRPGGAEASSAGGEPAGPVDALPTAPSAAPAPSVAPEGGRARRDWSSRAPRPAADPAPGDATVPTAAAESPRDGAPGERASETAAEGAPTEGRRSRRRRGERGDRGPDSPGRNQGAPNAGAPQGPATPPARADGGRGGRNDGGRANDGRGGGRDGGRGGGRDARRDGRAGGRGDASRDPRYDARLDAKADATDDWAPSEDAASTSSAAPAEPKMARLEQKVRAAGTSGRALASSGGANEPTHLDDDAPEPAEAGIAWGTDDPGPAPEVTLAADLPPNVEGDDDPATADLAEAGTLPVADEVANFAGVRFQPGGRVQWFDASEADYAVGDRVVVDAERGTKLGWIAIAPTRRSTRGFDQSRGPRRIVRKAHEGDLKHEREGDDQKARALRLAKDAAAALRLPLKVFRVEVLSGGKVNVYYTSDEMRMDMRAFVQNLTRELGGNPRIELRQLGVRDEAKAVGGIGTCGLTLCCTTWLPDFVPVSIKMAKDQGLVLSPTKVSGQCGRLKCCLVYEQANYAEMRKGLPKLGKRVVSARGEGRVVEVDVLHQRLRVSYGHGDSEVLPATEVKPLFPPGTQPPRPERGDRDDRQAPRQERSGRGPRPPRPEPGGDVSPEAAIAAQAVEDADDAEQDDDVPPDPSRDPNQYDEPDDDFPDPSRDPNAPDDDDL